MPVDFGIQLPSFPPGCDTDAIACYEKWLDALSHHFTTVWLSDHFQSGDAPSFEGWTRLTYMAAAFPRFKYGHLVLGQNYRNPALLAKMSATLQNLTGGRFILGIGAGWKEDEYLAYGYTFPSPGERVAQLGETIEILRAMWTQSPATYHGTHYHIENAYCEPRPNPMIPILVGTNGKKALRVTAQLADAWNWDAPLDNYQEPYNLLRQHCQDIARDFTEIQLTCGAEAHFPDNPADFVPSAPTEEGKIGPTPSDAIRQLRPLVELGVSHFQMYFTDLKTLERFGAEVAPALSEL
jgi:alkanesulfonate monooxygenase SsuD/methylene tetrahydromethanopterin reductase-like flavin-dependent oxidoreductase (luciferase family)